MALDIVVQSLLRLELFVGLAPRQVEALARRSDRMVYRPGQAIITEGETGDAAILLIAGDALRTVGPDFASGTVETVPEGALLGEMAMLVETVHMSTVVARTPVRAIRLTREVVRAEIEEDPDIGLTVSANLARRLLAVAAQMRAIDATLAALDATVPSGPADLPRLSARAVAPDAPTGHAVH
jgi:CRP-like cAMP-binding protein